MGGFRSHSEFFFCGKSSQNSSKPVLIFWSSIPLSILSVYTLIKVVSYYDLSVLSMDFQKKLDGVGGWGEVYPGFFFDFWNFLTLQSPLLSLLKNGIT